MNIRRFKKRDDLRDEVEFYHGNLSLLLKSGANPIAAGSVLDTYNEKIRELADFKDEGRVLKSRQTESKDFARFDQYSNSSLHKFVEKRIEFYPKPTWQAERIDFWSIISNAHCRGCSAIEAERNVHQIKPVNLKSLFQTNAILGSRTT